MNSSTDKIQLPFLDRHQAGRLLAQRLARLPLQDPVVIALPRGGIPVALEVARVLHAPLNLLFVRKIGTPLQPELALAAVVEGNPAHIVMDDPIQDQVQVSKKWLQKEVQRELSEIARRRRVYLRDSPPRSVKQRTVIVVDDGIATGTCAKAALTSLRTQGAAKIVLAIPVAPSDALERLRPDVDEIVCLAQPFHFGAIGAHYRDFHQLSDSEVVDLLAQADQLTTN